MTEVEGGGGGGEGPGKEESQRRKVQVVGYHERKGNEATFKASQL